MTKTIHDAPIPPRTVAAKGKRVGGRLSETLRSVRFRLTLMYSLTLFGVASILIGFIYWGLSNSLSNQYSRELLREETELVGNDLESVRLIELNVESRTLDNLRKYSYVALGGLFFVSFGAGWFTAGRVLAPIGRITRVAREIQATDLSRRIGMVGPNDDIKQLSDTFDAMLDRLQSAFDNQQRLIADTSHELRNPLAVMRTNLDVTLSDPQSDMEDFRHTAEIAQRSTERMSKLVDDLVTYARHEAATRTEVAVDFSEMLGDVADEFLVTAEANTLKLVVEIEPNLVVMGRQRTLEQAFANLLANALRFAPDESTITIKASAKDGWIWSTVADEGPGIAEEDRERAFDRYVRLGEGKAGRPHLSGGEGSGLGLAIVREVVQAHRGEVEIVDTEQGAKFAIWIPEFEAL